MEDEMTDKDIYLESLGKAIRYYRNKRGMTQEQLAMASGYEGNTPRSTMSKIESGKTDIPVSKLKEISTALNIPVKDICTTTDEVYKIRKWGIE
jgi:transcriptional regulator with XRE-family HTH domain